MLAPTLLETPCLEWGGPIGNHGYGLVRRDGRQWLLHRWMWTLNNGPIPDGMYVLHRCDNRRCFRLTHLFLGTHLDNIADMTAKRRSKNARKTHCPQGHPYDEENTRVYRGMRYCRACKAG